MADKLDFKKDLDAYQAKLRNFRIVEVPELRYLMIDGHGDPNSPEKLRTILRQPVRRSGDQGPSGTAR